DASNLGLVAPDETGPDFESIALDKARGAAEATGYDALADDTGLCVDALGGGPGLASARWAEAKGGWAPARRALAQQLGLTGDPRARARAQFVCALAWVSPHGESWSACARVSGQLYWPERGEGPGFVKIFEADAPPFLRDGVFAHRRLAYESLLARRAESAGRR